ncbi:site-specific integrase [Novosphingobium sp. 1949]|uniref:Site-specific integrase n=1 Tax=Novosphingobium organovorum TaxID=2930092 RepID=A0ABT0BFW2_9SPHN|nr:site-specific integrase [Novosphingobium organovorum]MCJ2183924.1 site-specific integrase [Novosphingobium organovorum]
MKRKGSANWYFRKRCPKHLKTAGVRDQVWISLETACYETALTRVDGAREEALRCFATKQREGSAIYPRSRLPIRVLDDNWPVLAPEQAAPLARAFLIASIREMDAEPTAIRTNRDDDLAWRAELETMLARVTGPEPDDCIDDVAGVRFAALRKAKLRTEPGSEACNLLHNYLRRAMAQSLKIRLARQNGDYSDKITDRLFANCLIVGDAEQGGASRLGCSVEAVPLGIVERPLGDVVERYLAEVLSKPTTDKTKDRYRAELKHIVSFFGRERPVWQIRAEECDKFRAAFSLLPPNFEDKIKGGKSIEAIIAERADEDRVLAWATLEKYLSQLTRLLRWAHKHDYVAKSYAENLKPLAAKPDGSMAKLPFEDEELQRIFLRPIYTGCRDDRRGFAKPGPNIVRRARYWAPLIGLFAGLRCGEILQLTTAHFRVSPEGHDFIVLTPDMKLKTENAEREVPVHPVLKAIGLVDWVNRRRERGELALFPEVPSHSAYGDQSSRFSKWYESDLRHFELGERRAKLTFHSFRHTFKRGLDRADIREDKKEELCGWARGKRTGRRYGTGLEADVLKACVDAVTFGVDLTHLFDHAAMDD